ncbi:MAG: glycosyltransferase [bacterium]|nr:glycosyltransferase [bacterium]
MITRCIVGGAQENTLATVIGLGRCGHEVTLITGPSRGREGCLLDMLKEDERVMFRVIEEPHLVREPHPWHDGMAYRRLRRHFLSEQYDIIHSHSSKAGILVRLAAREARRRGTKVVHTIHGLAFDRLQAWYANALYVGLERLCARDTDILISVCEAMTRQALAAGVGWPGQYVTIYSGMDLGLFFEARGERMKRRGQCGWGEHEVVLGYVGRLAPMKGAGDFLTVVREARAQDARVRGLIIGDGPEREALAWRAAQELPSGTVYWTGLVAPKEIAGWLAAADVLVHASLREGLARAVVQALAVGIPVVSYDAGGVREVAEHDVNSRICDLGDIEALVREVCAVVRDDTLRARLAKGAGATDLRRFSDKHMVERIVECYERVCER